MTIKLLKEHPFSDRDLTIESLRQLTESQVIHDTIIQRLDEDLRAAEAKIEEFGQDLTATQNELAELKKLLGPK